MLFSKFHIPKLQVRAARRAVRLRSRDSGARHLGAAPYNPHVSTPGDPSTAPTQSRIDRRRREAREQPSEGYLRRRHELELAAAAVMRRKGFHDMTLRDLADEVGAERASIYYYVAGKAELLADMVLRALLENEAALQEIAGQAASAGDK